MVEQIKNAGDYLKSITDLLYLYPYMVYVFSTRNGVFQQDSVPRHSARIALGWLQKLNIEFHLRLWLPNSTDLNPMKRICGAMEL